MDVEAQDDGKIAKIIVSALTSDYSSWKKK
jgi:hypothetical protein